MTELKLRFRHRPTRPSPRPGFKVYIPALRRILTTPVTLCGPTEAPHYLPGAPVRPPAESGPVEPLTE